MGILQSLIDAIGIDNIKDMVMKELGLEDILGVAENLLKDPMKAVGDVVEDAGDLVDKSVDTVEKAVDDTGKAID